MSNWRTEKIWMDGVAFECQFEFYKGSPARFDGPLAGPAEPPEAYDLTVYLVDMDGEKIDITHFMKDIHLQRLEDCIVNEYQEEFHD